MHATVPHRLNPAYSRQRRYFCPVQDLMDMGVVVEFFPLHFPDQDPCS